MASRNQAGGLYHRNQMRQYGIDGQIGNIGQEIRDKKACEEFSSKREKKEEKK